MANLWVRSRRSYLGERLSPRTRAFGANSQVADGRGLFSRFFLDDFIGR